jgi:hypothetical protein
VTVVVPDFLWNDGWWDVDVLEECHWGAKTAILDIEAKVAGAVVGVRNGAVDGCFVVEHGDGWGAGVAWAVEVVAGGCQANWMCFGPLEVDVTDEVCMGDFATPGDMGQFDEESVPWIWVAAGRVMPKPLERSPPHLLARPRSQMLASGPRGALFSGCGWSGGQSGNMLLAGCSLGKGAGCMMGGTAGASTAWTGWGMVEHW